MKTKEFDFDWKKLKKNQLGKFPPLRDLSIMSTKKTTRTCYNCRGTRFIELFHTSGKVTMRTCPQCNGQGVNLN